MTDFEVGDYVSIKFVDEYDYVKGLRVGNVVKVVGMFDTPYGTKLALVLLENSSEEYFICETQAELFLKHSEVSTDA